MRPIARQQGGYVVIQPRSNSNPSDDYLVVYHGNWTAYINGDVRTLAIDGRFKDYASAEKCRDELNKAQ